MIRPHILEVTTLTVPATLTQIDPTQVELEIAITPEELEAAREVAFRELSRNAKVPGFRPGKVPRKIFEQQYGRSVLDERAIEEVVPKAYSRAVAEHNLDPVAQPKVEFLPLTDAAGSLRVKAIVAVRPEIALGSYLGLTLEDPGSSASDDDVERSLDSLRRDAGTLVPVERAVQLGDVAILDYEGKIEGVPFDGGKAEQSPTEILEDRFIPGFASGIVGMRAGDTKDVTAHFPVGYGKDELADKDAVFTITVHEVKERELPPLDDALAARIAGREMTLDELKADIRSRLDTMVAQKSRQALTTQLTDKLLEMHEVPLPEVLVDGEIDALLEDLHGYVARADRSWEDYLAESGKTDEEIRADVRTEAERRVKTSLLLSSIARAESIDATEDDINREIALLAEQYQQPPERIVEMIRSSIGSLVAGIVRTKTLDKLVDSATIVPATAAASA